MPEKLWLENAKVAVDQKLQIGDFIATHGNNIYERFEEFDKQVQTSDPKLTIQEQDLSFIALCLPVVSGLMHVAATRANFQEAMAWVSHQDPKVDGTAMLSALTFLYMVQKGREDLSGDPLRNGTWDRIFGRVERFLDPRKTSSPAAA